MLLILVFVVPVFFIFVVFVEVVVDDALDEFIPEDVFGHVGEDSAERDVGEDDDIAEVFELVLLDFGVDHLAV